MGAGPGVTIIEGQGGQDVILTAPQADIYFSGMTLRNGRGPSGALLPGGVPYGGGFVNLGTATLMNVVIEESVSEAGAGVVNAPGATLFLVNSTVRNNTAQPGPAAGGATGGGGIANYGALTLVNTTVHDNLVQHNASLPGTRQGGGILNRGTLTLMNSTVSGNEVQNGSGGGIFQALALDGTTSTEMTQTTVAQNRATSGGGIGQLGSDAISLLSSIVADNQTRGNGTGPDCAATLTSQGWNLIEKLAGCTVATLSTDIVGVQPRLLDLADNGGETLTHAPRHNSPAIDAGPNGAACGGIDQRGVSRPVNGDGSGGARCDIGAVEYVP